MADVLVQVVDEHDRPVNGATKDEIWKQGHWHRIVRIMVEDAQGRLLLQKRAPHKQPYPDRWDNSAAGHVDQNETYEAAARRELAEELGIERAELEPVDTFKSQKMYEWRKLNRFNKTFRVVVNPNEVHVDDPDIAEVRWMTIPDIRQLIAEHPDKVTDGLRDAIARYYTINST